MIEPTDPDDIPDWEMTVTTREEDSAKVTYSSPFRVAMEKLRV